MKKDAIHEYLWNLAGKLFSSSFKPGQGAKQVLHSKSPLINLSTPSTITHETWKFMYKKSNLYMCFSIDFVLFTDFISKKFTYICIYTQIFFGLTFTWEVCTPRSTGSKATDDGLDFLLPEGAGFRV